MDISLKEFKQAKKRIASTLHYTQIEYSLALSEMSGGDVYLKCENHQKTGSFKIRGATNKIVKMVENGDYSPVVASSAGNHAQGVAHAAKNFGIKATIVMPKKAPLTKVEATKGYGAEVVLYGDVYDDAYEKACEICKERNAKFIHPYNDIDVVAGQGTIALEILNEINDVDIIVVPAGGGGLLAGISTAAKKINPKVKVFGVQAKGANAISKSFKAKKLLETSSAITIADGIAVKKPGDLAFDLIMQNVDDVLEVSEDEISNAVLQLMERCKEVVEPAGAAPVAAIISKKIDVKGKKVVCVTSGGNIDVTSINGIIEKGLIDRHRRTEFFVIFDNIPGALSKLSNTIEQLGAHILDLEVDRVLATMSKQIRAYVVLETSGHKHEKQILTELEKLDYQVIKVVDIEKNI